MQSSSASSKITIGVVIPVFNRPHDAQAAIASVRAQTVSAHAIVVVDDGSDPALSLSPAHAADPRIVLLRQPRNAGPAAARQRGVEHLTTTHVAFLDSDDTWHPEKLAHQLAHLELLARQGDAGVTALAAGWDAIDASGSVIHTRVPRSARGLGDFCSGCWFCPGSTLLVDRARLLSIGGFDPALRRLEDLDLFIRWALAGGKLAVTPIIGARIRWGGNGSRAIVDPAAERIRGKFTGMRSPLVSRSDRRRLRSWLAVEEAAAANKDGDVLRAASRLLASVALAPRTRVQLEEWWSDETGVAGPIGTDIGHGIRR